MRAFDINSHDGVKFDENKKAICMTKDLYILWQEKLKAKDNKKRKVEKEQFSDELVNTYAKNYKNNGLFHSANVSAPTLNTETDNVINSESHVRQKQNNASAHCIRTII